MPVGFGNIKKEEKKEYAQHNKRNVIKEDKVDEVNKIIEMLNCVEPSFGTKISLNVLIYYRTYKTPNYIFDRFLTSSECLFFMCQNMGVFPSLDFKL